MKGLLITMFLFTTFANEFIRYPYPGLPSSDLDNRKDYLIFRRKQQAYLLMNMLRVDPQGFVEKYMKPIVADNSWRLLFKTESIRLKKFPDYYPLYQDALLEQTATHARIGESFANVRSRLKQHLPHKLDGFVPGYKPLKLLAQTLMWKTSSQNDFFNYLCHGNYNEELHGKTKDLSLSGCKPDYVNRKTPRGRVRFLLRPSGAVGCNHVNTMVKENNLFACDMTFPDFSPRLRVKSPMIAGNWFHSGVGQSRIYALVIHVPRHEKVNAVHLVIDGKMIDIPLAYQNGVSKVYSISYQPLVHSPSKMKGYFFHAEINGKNFFYPAQYYYDWNGRIKLDTKQRYNGNCKIPFPDRTCDVCEDGYRRVNGTCVKCPLDNCATCNENICLTCAKGHMLSYGTCDTKCIDNCDVCSYTTTCDVCSPTHFLNTTNGTCTLCKEKFQDCQTCTNDKCLTYICQHTDPLCDHKYTPGLYYSNVTQKCEKCSEGCKKCEYNENKGSKCLMCDDGLFLTKEGECIPCHYVEGCKPGQCDGFRCLECKKGYYKTCHSCAKCDESCAHCVGNGTCLMCNEGYFLDPEFGKCVEHYEVENCAQKNALGVCVNCTDGYGFDKYKKCVKCDASCKDCHFADKCKHCKDGFFNDHGHCIPCSRRNCDLCNANECFSCQPNSFLHNGVCVRGPPGCSLCHNSAPVCRVCEKGMKMDGNHCIPDCDIKNCAHCNGDDTCRYCKSTLNPYGGYEPAPNGTEPCPFVCDPVELNCLITEEMKSGKIDACFSLGCKYCPPHTFRRNHKCVECGDGCSHCLSETECIQCLPGYSYYMGKCYECNANGTCGEGQFMNNCKCTNCTTKFAHCAACDKEQCIECAPHFTLNENRTTCIPCTKKLCPHEQHEITDCEEEPEIVEEPCKANFSRIGDEFFFDPLCVEHDKNCYCTKCICGAVLNNRHICEEVPQEKRIDLCCNAEDGCCLSCPTGYVLDKCQCTKTCECGEPDSEGNCAQKSFIENCKTVTCDNECEKCLDGYYLVNNTSCEACVGNCTHCNSSDSCVECADGFHLNETSGLCVTCLSNCTGNCDSTGLVCESCAPGQYLNETTGECQTCTNCQQCVVNEDVVYCTVCNDGSTPVNGVCAKSTTFSRSYATSTHVALFSLLILFAFLF
ncbi:TNFR-Cys domain-containing protein [Entamoeba marina]